MRPMEETHDRIDNNKSFRPAADSDPFNGCKYDEYSGFGSVSLYK